MTGVQTCALPISDVTICVWALAADSEADARHHALSRERWRLDRARGHLGPLRPPDEVAAQGFDPADEPALARMRQAALVGSAAQVGQQLRALCATLALDELVINTWAYEPGVRRHSYALLSREFDLAGRP